MVRTTSTEMILSEPVVAGTAPTSFLQGFAYWICDWWINTTHPHFRKSHANATYRKYIMVPLFWLLLTSCDLYATGISFILSLDTTAAVATIASLMYLKADTMFVDVALVGICFCYMITVRVLGELGFSLFASLPWVTALGDVCSVYCFAVLLIYTTSGVHPSCAIAVTLCNMVLPVGVSWQGFIVQVCIFPFFCWLLVSQETEKWQVYMDGVSNKALLDHGSDGYFVLCLNSGTILRVKDVLDSELKGMVRSGFRLLDLISSTDQCKVGEMMSGAPAHVFSSALVTFRLPSFGAVVDCKITSYAISGRQLSFRIQKVGEVRPLNVTSGSAAIVLETPSTLHDNEDSTQKVIQLLPLTHFQISGLASQSPHTEPDSLISVCNQAQGEHRPLAPVPATTSAGGMGCGGPAGSNATRGISGELSSFIPHSPSVNAMMFGHNLVRRRFVDMDDTSHNGLSCVTASSQSFDSVLQNTLHDAWNVLCIETLLTDEDVQDAVSEARRTWDLINAQGTYLRRRAAARACIHRISRFAMESVTEELYALEFSEDVRHRRQQLDDRMESLDDADAFANDWEIMREQVHQDVECAHMVFRRSGAFRDMGFLVPLGIVCAMLGGPQVRPHVGRLRRLQGSLTRAAITAQIGVEAALQIGAAL